MQSLMRLNALLSVKMTKYIVAKWNAAILRYIPVKSFPSLLRARSYSFYLNFISRDSAIVYAYDEDSK